MLLLNDYNCTLSHMTEYSTNLMLIFMFFFFFQNWAAVLVQNGWLQSQVVRSKREGLPMPPSGRSYKSHVARLFKAMNRLRTLRRSEPEEVLDSSKIFSRIDARCVYLFIFVRSYD